jgi:hypothetical protein
MKNFILYIFLCVSLTGLFAQSNSGGLWFTPEIYQANRLNPAFTGDRKVVIGLPSTYFGIANSAFALQDMLEGDGRVNLGPVISSLDPQNYVRTWADIQGFALGLRIAKMQFGIDWRVRASGYLRYSDRMAQLFWYGNGAFIDETLQVGPDLQLTAFSEFALRFNMPVMKKLHVGGSLKVLNGLADISTSRNQFSLYTDPEYYQITTQTDYQIDASVGLNDFVETISNPNAWQLSQGSGLALDLGLKYQFNDQLSFAASILDLGQVNWNGVVSNYHSQGRFTYDGLPIGAYSQADSGVTLNFLVDTLNATFAPEQKSEAYQTGLPTRFMIGATWEPIKLVRLGALYEREWYRGENFDALSLHGGIRWKDRIYAGLTYTMQETFQNRLGGQIMGKLGPIQVYAFTGNLLTLFNYLEGKTADARIGVNLVFGKVKKGE